MMTSKKQQDVEVVPFDLSGDLFERLQVYATDVNISVKDAAKVMLRQGLDSYHEARSKIDRLKAECANLDKASEQAMAEEGMSRRSPKSKKI